MTMGFSIAAALSLAVATSRSHPQATSSGAELDARRIRTGRFEYRMMKQDKRVAGFTITIQKQGDGRFRFTGEASGFNQRWVSIATASFEPISASLRLERAENQTYAMSLQYDGGHVIGTATTENPTAGSGRPESEQTPIDATVPAGTIDQRIDWAAVLSSRLETGREFRFTVYDPGTGVSQVFARVGVTARTRVPAGTFETTRVVYRIEKSKGTESYEILATRELPRLMVREEFPNGMVTELETVGPVEGGK